MKLKVILFSTLTATLLFAQSGKELFDKHCSICHIDIVGVDESGGDTRYITEKAPYIKDIIEKLKAKTQTKEKFVEFIKNYMSNPDRKKSLYGKRAIKKFGIMPPLKSITEDEDKIKVANYLYDYEKHQKVVKIKAKVVAKKKSEGEKLFNKYCSTCHTSIVGVNESGGDTTYIMEKAPYVKDVVEKLKEQTKTKDKFALFIKNYIEQPTKRKSLYGKRAIKKFGLMPSLKGVMDDEQKEQLINYLYNEVK